MAMDKNEQKLNIFIMLYCHYRDRIIHQLAVEPAATCLDVLRGIEKSEFDSILFCIADIIIFNTIFVSSHMYPENPEETQVIIGSMNMGYISDTARNRTHNLFRPKREPIPLQESQHPWVNIINELIIILL